jgi:hypothetical protein
MVNIPGQVPPPLAPQVPPKKLDETHEARKDLAPARSSVGRDVNALDSQAIAVRMAALSMDAKEKELSFEDIVDKVIKETGLINPQSAMEEADRKLQKEIELELQKIKESKELMEEARAWQDLADLLESNLDEEQVNQFISLLEHEVKK